MLASLPGALHHPQAALEQVVRPLWLQCNARARALASRHKQGPPVEPLKLHMPWSRGPTKQGMQQER